MTISGRSSTSDFIQKLLYPGVTLGGLRSRRGSTAFESLGRRRMLLWIIEFPGLDGRAVKRIPADLLLDPFISQFQSGTQGLGGLPM
jgi:hypothetical protein